MMQSINVQYYNWCVFILKNGFLIVSVFSESLHTVGFKRQPQWPSYLKHWTHTVRSGSRLEGASPDGRVV